MSASDQGMRLSKHLSQSGVCSRREADRLIEQGLVLVNGQTAVLGQKVLPSDDIEVLKHGQNILSRKISIIIHKPIGYVSAQAENGYQPALRLVRMNSLFGPISQDCSQKALEGLAPAGRLDIDSKGLLLLTQDGVVAKSIIGPETNMEKEYIVKVSGALNAEKISKLCKGLSLDGRDLKPAKVKEIGEGLLNFELKEGRKRQIRRMCELVDLQVLMLKRIRIGPIALGDLPEGMWRPLTAREIEKIKAWN